MSDVVDSSGATKAEEKPASRADREKLAELIHSLSSEQLGNLVTMISKSCPEAVAEVCGRFVLCFALCECALY